MTLEEEIIGRKYASTFALSVRVKRTKNYTQPTLNACIYVNLFSRIIFLDTSPRGVDADADTSRRGVDAEADTSRRGVDADDDDYLTVISKSCENRGVDADDDDRGVDVDMTAALMLMMMTT